MSRAIPEDVARRDAQLLQLLIECAEEGKRVPSNAELAEILGVARPNTACGAVKRLERAGLITVERFGVSRVVTIKATGKSTPGTGDNRVRWTRREGSTSLQATREPVAQRTAVAAAEASAELVRVNREPCTFCGIRADIGCRHSRAARRLMFVPVSFHAAQVGQS